MYKQNLLEMTQINPRTAKLFSLTNQPSFLMFAILAAILDFLKNIYILAKLQDIFD